MANRRDRVVTAPEILVGEPTIRGTRISVALILGHPGNGWSIEDIVQNYPHVTREDVLAALDFAAEFMRDERFLVTQAEDASAE